VQDEAVLDHVVDLLARPVMIDSVNPVLVELARRVCA
jgi:hypothetical protein